MYDPDYDYSANPRYKVTYLCANNVSGLYSESDRAFAHWAGMMNVDYKGMIDFAGDNDGMLSQIPQIARDNDGLIFDAEQTYYPRIAEIMKETGVPWMSFMAAPRDYEIEGAPLMAPYVGFEQKDVGAFFGEYLYNKAATEWPGVPYSDIGFIVVDFSGVQALHDRAEGAREALEKLDPDMEANRYFPADTADTFFDADSSREVVSKILAENPGITYWLVFAEIDDMAIGAAEALEAAGLTDTSFVSAFGGTPLLQQWEAGIQTAWKSAQFLPQVIYTEPIFGALYAFMNGYATPESIYPEWKNVHESTRYGSYATRLLPWYEMTYDNYKHLLEWSDVYADSNIFDFPDDGIDRDDFDVFIPVPDNYK